ELRLGHGRESGEEAGERPAAAARDQQRAQERDGAHGVNLAPVRSAEDRGGLQHPEAGGEDRRAVSGMTADEWYHEQHDGDVRRDADRFDPEAEDVTVEARSDRPEDVQEPGRVVAEVARL